MIGSISHRTLRPEDLCAVFFEHLKELDEEAYEGVLDETIEALHHALHDAAPAYTYFGAREGDGSDFGFWPDGAAIDALPLQSEAEPGDDYKVVNDHGNVTVFGADGTVLLEVV